MKTLAIDIETYSSNDLLKSGVYKYVQAVDFAILLFAFSIDEGPVRVVDFAQGEGLPRIVKDYLQAPEVLKTAYNANFERTCIARYLKYDLPPYQWECTMAKASMLGLPLSLDAASKALHLQEEKLSEGKTLIRYFSIPCKPTKANGGRTRNLPEHDPEKWERFKKYCASDVKVELAIRNKINFFTIPDNEKKLWQLDQKINDTGILLDPVFVNNAIVLDKTYREKLVKEAIELTQLENPNSGAQLKSWLEQEIDEEIQNLKKENIPNLLTKTDSKIVKRVLRIRQELSKTSVKKYIAMYKSIGSDNRVRGLLQFYGANRTGRWAGRLVQVQNLPKNQLKDLDLARRVVRSGDLELLEMLYSNIPDTLSQLIRTSFVAPKGSRFIVSDFSAIEARVIAWLAGERWRLDVFNTHGKIYEESASRMFKVPIGAVTKESDYRAKGKISELALGFGGGVKALLKMGAIKMGLSEDDLPELVSKWRGASLRICKYWKDIENAAIEAVETGLTVTLRHVKFYTYKNILFIQLPSGRKLSYYNVKLRPGKFGNDVISYEGVDQDTKKWGVQETYGGKLVENIVQGIARDLLAFALLNLDAAGYVIPMHIHDEIVNEMINGNGTVDEVNEIMSIVPSWAQGLPLAADGFELQYYRKDQDNSTAAIKTA